MCVYVCLYVCVCVCVCVCVAVHYVVGCTLCVCLYATMCIFLYVPDQCAVPLLCRAVGEAYLQVLDDADWMPLATAASLLPLSFVCYMVLSVTPKPSYVTRTLTAKSMLHPCYIVLSGIPRTLYRTGNLLFV